MRRTRFLAIASLALLVAGTASAQPMYTSAYATCSPPDSVYVIWTTYDPTGDPYAVPNFVGYDVLRRPVPGCGQFERMNEDFVPRFFGTMTHYFGLVSPSPETLYEYFVQPVDADHQLVPIPGFCVPCVANATCTPLTTPFTAGTLIEGGFAVIVMPCPGTCYPTVYVTDSQADELRPYVGTSTTVRLYGIPYCGSVEGCRLELEHWEIAPCGGIASAAGRTWGQLKIRYR